MLLVRQNDGLSLEGATAPYKPYFSRISRAFRR